MTYYRTVRRLPAAPRAHMGGWLNDGLYQAYGIPVPKTMDEKQGSQCIKDALAAQQNTEDYILDLVKNWNPSGYYSVGDAQKLVGGANDLLLNTIERLKTTPTAGASDAEGQVANEIARCNDYIAKGKKFADAIALARANRLPYIDAPDLKRWVVFSMRQASDGIVTSLALACDRNLLSWVQSAGEFISSAAGRLWQIAKSVFSFAADVAALAQKVVAETPDYLNLLAWAAAAGLGFFVYRKLSEAKKARDEKPA